MQSQSLGKKKTSQIEGKHCFWNTVHVHKLKQMCFGLFFPTPFNAQMALDIFGK